MHSPWVGVDLGTDQVAWARLLRCAHDVMLSERGTPAVLRDLIVRSWARCIEARVDPEQPAQPVLDKDETLHRLDAHPLVTVVPVVHELFADVAQDARHLAVLADAQGLLLWAEGHPEHGRSRCQAPLSARLPVQRTGDRDATPSARHLPSITRCRSSRPSTSTACFTGGPLRPRRFTTPTQKSCLAQSAYRAPSAAPTRTRFRW